VLAGNVAWGSVVLVDYSAYHVNRRAMACAEKTRLVEEYSAATSAFSEAVKELRRKIGTSPKEEYKRLAQNSNEARVNAEQARLALEQHISAHHC
jgi:hypothetical protein